MKGLAILGVILLLGGGYVFFQGASFTKDETVMKVGPLEAQVEQRQTIPPWVGAAGAVVGLVLIAAGLRKPA